MEGLLREKEWARCPADPHVAITRFITIHHSQVMRCVWGEDATYLRRVWSRGSHGHARRPPEFMETQRRYSLAPLVHPVCESQGDEVDEAA